MSEFYARVSPVGYVQLAGTLGFGATAAVFKTKRAAQEALADAAKTSGYDVEADDDRYVIEGAHDEVGAIIPEPLLAKKVGRLEVQQRTKKPRRGTERGDRRQGKR